MKKKTADRNELRTFRNISSDTMSRRDTMSNFIPLSKDTLNQYNQNKVKKHYLDAIGTAIFMVCKVVVEYLTPTELKVSGDPAELKKAFSFFAAEYTPVMKGSNGLDKTPPYFTITRNPLSSFDGEYKASKESGQCVKDRQRLSAGLFRWNPTGALLTKNSDPNCAPNKRWIITAASGKVLGTCSVLNGEGWPFVAGQKKQ